MPRPDGGDDHRPAQRGDLEPVAVTTGGQRLPRRSAPPWDRITSTRCPPAPVAALTTAQAAALTGQASVYWRPPLKACAARRPCGP
jgi:hypothetical protein